MDGVAIVYSLLAGDAGIAGLSPVPTIASGVLPAGTPLDAIAITRISGVDLNVIAPGATRHVTERVQVTALAATYPRQKAILRAVKHALADFIGSAAGLTNVTIQTDHAGPDFMDEEASIRAGTQDFIVGYLEPR